jgi:hypothetical protein
MNTEAKGKNQPICFNTLLHSRISKNLFGSYFIRLSVPGYTHCNNFTPSFILIMKSVRRAGLLKIYEVNFVSRNKMTAHFQSVQSIKVTRTKLSVALCGDSAFLNLFIEKRKT